MAKLKKKKSLKSFNSTKNLEKYGIFWFWTHYKQQSVLTQDAKFPKRPYFN